MRWSVILILALAACGTPAVTKSAQCIDGAKDGSESDVDCGGGTCAPCAGGQACLSGTDCASRACVNHACVIVPAQCTDGALDGNETDVDCGGGVCSTCSNGKACIGPSDCDSGSCVNHVCMTPPAQCIDNMKDGSETDVDCGGGTCATCANGKACQAGSDCTSGSCANHVCSVPPVQCTDGQHDGNETDVDCGGDTCAPCLNGKACVIASDCASGSCVNHLCAQPVAQCLDNALDGNETDTDCGGGTCPACANNKRCVAATDCQSGTCINHVCASPPAQCLDNMKDGGETDSDCGGGTCPACANGKSCLFSTDCQSGSCMSGVCVSPPAQCLDNMKDGGETDVDCGGGTCLACVGGRACAKGTDCQSGVCSSGNGGGGSGGSGGGGSGGSGGGGGSSGICVSPPAQCLDNMLDGNETDVDCGGGACPACANEKHCAVSTDCSSEDCSQGVCLGQTSSNGCVVTCGGTSGGCQCTSSCNGHTYDLFCSMSSSMTGELNCFCEPDGQTMSGPTTSGTCSDLSALFELYSASPSAGCGFPGTLG